MYRMSRSVKPQRTYDSSRRQEQAQQNRRTILEVAHRRFVSDGYAATTMGAVAAGADVSVETIYKAFRNKPGLVKAVLDVSVVGDDEPIPMLQREFVQRNTAEPDPRIKLQMYGEHLTEIGPRSFPLQLVVRDAAVSDAGAAEVWAQMQAERLTGMTAFATHLADGGHLRGGLAVEDARDILWLHNSVDVWDLLVNQRGWSEERWGTWIGAQLIAALL
jgi:AcrR family transcriptional regulator